MRSAFTLCQHAASEPPKRFAAAPETGYYEQNEAILHSKLPISEGGIVC